MLRDRAILVSGREFKSWQRKEEQARTGSLTAFCIALLNAMKELRRK